MENTTDPGTFEPWRTVDAPLTDERIMAMVEGKPVHLILWPGSRPGTRYVIERQGRMWLTVSGMFPTGDGRLRWQFMDHTGMQWEALTADTGTAHAATLMRVEGLS